MTKFKPPYWTFRSEKGLARQINKDVFSLLETENATWIFAFDIATSSIATSEMAEFYIQHFWQQINIREPSDGRSIRKYLNRAFDETKRLFKMGKSSFILICRIREGVYCFNAGDCRMGILKEHQIEWLTQVHTGANPLGELFTPEMRRNDMRHILTRSLNLQRPFIPEENQVNISINDIVVIATDGFWAEFTDDEQLAFLQGEEVASQDDTSAIIISWKAPRVQGMFKNSGNNLMFNTTNATL